MDTDNRVVKAGGPGGWVKVGKGRNGGTVIVLTIKKLFHRGL